MISGFKLKSSDELNIKIGPMSRPVLIIYEARKYPHRYSNRLKLMSRGRSNIIKNSRDLKRVLENIKTTNYKKNNGLLRRNLSYM